MWFQFDIERMSDFARRIKQAALTFLSKNIKNAKLIKSTVLF